MPLSTANEVPAITNADASGSGTATIAPLDLADVIGIGGDPARRRGLDAQLDDRHHDEHTDRAGHVEVEEPHAHRDREHRLHQREQPEGEGDAKKWTDFIEFGPEDAMTSGPAGFDKTAHAASPYAPPKRTSVCDSTWCSP